MDKSDLVRQVRRLQRMGALRVAVSEGDRRIEADFPFPLSHADPPLGEKQAEKPMPDAMEQLVQTIQTGSSEDYQRLQRELQQRLREGEGHATA